MEILRAALRNLLRRPRLALLVGLTLALGLGATTIVLSVGEKLLGPPPYPEPDRLVVISSERQPQGNLDRISFPDFHDLRRESRTFEQAAAWSDLWNFALAEQGGAERARARFVSASYFPLLGARTVLGRTFSPSEDEPPAGAEVVVISHALWQERWAGDRGLLGRPARIGDRTYTVIGVLEPSFRELSPDGQADLWLPVASVSQAIAPAYLELRGHRWLSGLARLPAGLALPAAQKAASGLAGRLATDFPASNQGIDLDLAPVGLHAFGRRDVGRTTLLLALGAFFVLLVGCVNVVNLLLVEHQGRRRELALRLALGSGQGPLLAQLVLECLLLTLLGGVLGVALAVAGLSWLGAASPLPLPPYVTLEVSPFALAASFALTLLTGVLVGAIPGLASLRVNLREVLAQEGRGSSSRSSGRARRLLVALQVAAALALLIGAGLLIRSLQHLAAETYGFDTEDLWVVQLLPSDARYGDPGALAALTQELEAAARGVQGLRSVMLWGPGRAGASEWYREVVPEERSGQELSERCLFFEHRVSPAALRELAIPLRTGRLLEAGDRGGAAGAAVISASAADACWPGADPLGKRFRRGPASGPWFSVVGVVADVRHRGRREGEVPAADAYYPLEQVPTTVLHLLFRTSRTDPALLRDLAAAVQRVDSEIPLYDLASYRDLKRREEGESRFLASLLGAYAAVGLLLAALGLYGVLSFLVGQRGREIAIQMALGADARAVTRLVLGELAAFVLLGLAGGLLAARGLAASLGHLLFEVRPVDPMTWALVPLGLLALCALASLGPLWRALATQPAEAMRRS